MFLTLSRTGNTRIYFFFFDGWHLSRSSELYFMSFVQNIEIKLWFIDRWYWAYNFFVRVISTRLSNLNFQNYFPAYAYIWGYGYYYIEYWRLSVFSKTDWWNLYRKLLNKHAKMQYFYLKSIATCPKLKLLCLHLFIYTGNDLPHL